MLNLMVFVCYSYGSQMMLSSEVVAEDQRSQNVYNLIFVMDSNSIIKIEEKKEEK